MSRSYSGPPIAAIIVLVLGACGTHGNGTADTAGASPDACCGIADSGDASLGVGDADIRNTSSSDGAASDVTGCECPVHARRCDDQGGLKVCGEDCRWRTVSCESGRCEDGVCCECGAEEAECALSDTALRICSNGCTWEMKLCRAGCVDNDCCEPCGPDFGRCVEPLVYEYCRGGCVARWQCAKDGDFCASANPHAPYTQCVHWPGGGTLAACTCHSCRGDEDCGNVHTFGTSCEEHNRKKICVCHGDGDCLGKTAGPKCLNGLCGCTNPDHCPSGEQCVPGNAHLPKKGHQLCSGNARWPREGT